MHLNSCPRSQCLSIESFNLLVTSHNLSEILLFQQSSNKSLWPDKGLCIVTTQIGAEEYAIEMKKAPSNAVYGSLQRLVGREICHPMDVVLIPLPYFKQTNMMLASKVLAEFS